VQSESLSKGERTRQALLFRETVRLQFQPH